MKDGLIYLYEAPSMALVDVPSIIPSFLQPFRSLALFQSSRNLLNVVWIYKECYRAGLRMQRQRSFDDSAASN